MSEFFIPYRLSRSKSNTRNVTVLNQVIDIIEKKLQDVSEDSFGTNKTLILGGSDFRESSAVGNAYVSGSHLQSTSNTLATEFVGPVDLPDTAVISSIQAYWFRDAAGATGTCRLNRADFEENVTEMGAVDSDASTGFHDVTDSSISNATIDVDNYTYYVKIAIDPDGSLDDVHFNALVITYDLPV